MNGRLHRARRVLAVQAQLDKLALWKLAEIDLQASALEERRLTLVSFMEREPAFAGVFASTMMRHLASLGEQLAIAKTARDAQRRSQLAERRRLRRAQRIVQVLEDAFERQNAARELAEAIEIAMRYSGKAPASLPEHHREDLI
jgi:hypothetical protein